MTKQKITVLRPTDDCSALQYAVGEGESLVLCHIAGSEPCRVEIRLAADATVQVLFAAAEGSTSDIDYRILFEGRRAELKLYGLFMAAEGERRTVRTEVRHEVPDCRSEQTIKGIASGSGEGLFDGLVYVAPDAQHTEALQQSRNLLLSSKARIETRPQLEIYADDVHCSHGAAVGQMDNEAIYYMRQRGIDELQARRLQMSGFARDVVAHCPDAELLEELTAIVDRKIETL